MATHANTHQGSDREPLLQPQDHTATVVQIHSHDHQGSDTSSEEGEPSRQAVFKVVPDRLEHHREMVHDRFSLKWWWEWFLIIVVFSITGSSTMMIVKPLMRALGITGTLGAGPWSYRIAYVVLTFPLYSCMLLLISTLVGRRGYFSYILLRMWGRVLPRSWIQKCSGER